MPSNFRSNSQSPPLKRSCVRVAAIGSSQSGILTCGDMDDRTPSSLTETPSDPELERLVKNGRHLAAFKLLQELRRAAQHGRPQRAPFDEMLHDMLELKRRGTPFGAVLAVFIGSLLVVALVILGLSAIGLRVSEWTLFPAIDWVLAIVMPLVFLPGVLPALAAGIFVFGIVLAHRFRSPALFAAGITGISLGLVCFWLFPTYIQMLNERAPIEAEAPLLIIGGVISFLLFVGGIQLVAQANK